MAESTSELEKPRSWPLLRVPNGMPRAGWYLASLGLFALLLQIVTGLLLLVHFRPGDGAWDSVAHVTARVPYGWLFRGLHALGCHLLIATGIAHGLATFASRAFKSPRQYTWLTGACAFAVVIALAATGSVLPADRHAALVATIGTRLVAAVPAIGSTLASMAGGTDGGVETMHRFFALHVGLLPAALAGFAAAHLLLVRARGASAAASPQDMPWFHDFFRREVVLWVVALHVMAAAVAVFPPEVLPRGDALEPTPEGSRPAWFFMPAYQLLRLLPARAAGLRADQLAVTAALASVALLISLPFWASSERTAARIAVSSIAAAWLATLAILAIWGYAVS